MDPLRVGALRALVSKDFELVVGEVEGGENKLLDYLTLHSMLLSTHSAAAAAPTPVLAAAAGRSPFQPAQEQGCMQIFIRTLTGKTITLHVNPTSTIDEVKARIEDREGIPAAQMRIIFHKTQLDEGTLAEHSVSQEDTLYLVLRYSGGALTYYQIDPETFHPQYDCDFTDVRDDGERFLRGNEVYRPPYGWNRLAIRVFGKYGTNNRWLRQDGSPDEWPAAFHGTGYHNAKTIAQVGFDLAKHSRHAYGKGVYTTPDVDVAEMYAQQHTLEDGTVIRVVLQSRVNPKTLIKIPESETRVGEFWVSPSEDDVRPYGICVKVVSGPDGANGSASPHPPAQAGIH